MGSKMNLSEVCDGSKLSVEYEELDAAEKSRYTEKLKLITADAVDPYLVTGEVGDNFLPFIL